MKIDPVALAFSFAEQWRRRELGKKLVRKFAPRFAERRAAKRAQRAARQAQRPRQHDEAAGEFFQPEDRTTMLAGAKSWIGMLGMGIGFVLNLFGIGDCTPDAVAAATCVAADTITADLLAAADKIITGVFGVITVWGIVHKQIREKRLKAALDAAAKK